MTTQADARDRFRKAFVLALVFAISIVFIATIRGFLEALFLAAVFSGLMHPLYRWLRDRFRGREALASITTLLIALIAIVMPLIGFFGIVVAQALEVTEALTPWLQERLNKSAEGGYPLPDWIPFADKLEPYRADITAKLAELASKTGGFLVTSLSKATQGTVVFFLNLFVMLYAMFFFLISGRSILQTMMGYLPLSGTDKDNLLNVGLSVSRATIKGTLIIGIVQGALGGIGLAVAGIPGSAFWGTLMVVLSIIPGVGTALVWVPAVIYLLINGQTVAGIGLAIWSAAVVGTVDNVLRPRLVGRDTKMPDLLVLLSTLGGLALFGAVGLVIGPVIAALFLTAWTIYGQVFSDWLSEADSSESDLKVEG